MQKNAKIFDLVTVAFAAALIAVCSWISIPMAVPFTLQTFAICCVLPLFGGKRGSAAVLLYLLLGLVGVPVFAGFNAGPGVLLGATGGYLLGFLLMGLMFWLLIRLLGERTWVQLLALLLGMAAVYAFGTAWFMVVYARATGPVGLLTALSWCVFPFIVPDLLKLVLALTLSKRLAVIRKKVRAR